MFRPAKQNHHKDRLAAARVVMPPAGSAPGQLAVDPEQLQLPTRITLMGYGPNHYEEMDIQELGKIDTLLERYPILWVNIVGLGNAQTIEQIGGAFGLHRLVLEDVLNLNHRPKVEDYDEYLFIIIKKGMMNGQFDTEQVSMILGERWVITFQEQADSHFDLVRDRIRTGIGKIRQYGSDYLAYALIDAIVDGYYPILDTINLRLEGLEKEIIENEDDETIGKIHHIKSDLLFLHRAVWPMRDILKILAHNESPFVTPGTVHYLRDCLDQSLQVTELCEFYRDIAAGLMHTLLAYSGHKANEIMKVLTMVSAIFIPLSFIASVYGMNFHTDSSPFNMPELNWHYGYPAAMGLMFSVALGMLVMFFRRGWIGRSGK